MRLAATAAISDHEKTNAVGLVSSLLDGGDWAHTVGTWPRNVRKNPLHRFQNDCATSSMGV